MKYWASVLIAMLSVTGCTQRMGVTPSAGPWQFSGTVFAKDGQLIGAPVSGAQLTIGSSNAVRAKTLTDASGHYVFDGLESGSFSLTISAPGFITLTPGLNLDRNMRADFVMTRQ